MAKHKHQHASEAQEQATEAAPAAVSDLVIAGNSFRVADHYAEGHILTAAEANVLNQTRRENLRNNFAKKVKDVLGADAPKGALLDGDSHAKLQAELDAYAAEYSFEAKARSGRPRVTDPVEKEARRLAQQIVDTALNARNLARKDLMDGVYDGLVTKVLGDRPEIREQARTQVEARNQMAAATVDGLMDNLAVAPGAEAAE